MPSMRERHLYEYAVIRFVPRVEREEFMNVGLIMMCKCRRWIRVALHCDPARIEAFAPCSGSEGLRAQLDSFTRIVAGCPGPIGSLEAHERFRWLTAVRSACVQTSRPHPGVTDDLDATFDRLMAELVLPAE